MVTETIFNAIRSSALWLIGLFPNVNIDFATWGSSWSTSFLGQIKHMLNYFLGVSISNAVFSFIFIAAIGIVAFAIAKFIKFVMPVA